MATRQIVLATLTASFQEGFQTVAREYERRHPGTRVRVEILPVNGYETWLRTQINGDRSSGPDLYIANYAWGLYEKGLVANLTQAVDSVNPYTGKRWRETLSDPFLERGKVNGDIALIPLDFIEIAFYYNKSHFDRLGLAPPRTWDDMLVVGKRLRKAGLVPFAVPGNADSYWGGAVGWIARFFSDAYLRPFLPQVMSRPGDWDYDPVRNGRFRLNVNDPFNDSLVVVNPERNANLVRSRAFRFDSPRFAEMYERIREFSALWQRGFHGTSQQNAYHLFLSGHAGVYLDTSAAIGQLLRDMDDLPRSARFPWGVFAVPPLTRSAFKIPAFRGVGGAGVMLSVVRKSDAQTKASIDFLQFLTSPESIRVLVENALRFKRPLTGPMLVPGAPLREAMQAYFRAFEGKGFEKLTYRGLGDEQQSVWEWTVQAQRYMEGQIPLGTFLTRYQRLMTEAVPRAIAASRYDMDPRTKDRRS